MKTNWFRNDVVRFSVFLAFVILLFLTPAIFSNGYYAPADNIRRNFIFLDGTQPHNYLLTDPLVQMMPWHKIAREAIHNGHLPLWNPYSGGGAPLLANPQASILFPLTWLHFIFSAKAAFILVAFCKLFLIGFWTYLYLRELKMRPLVAAIGGVAFAFCGFNIVWLAWPLPAVTAALPCALFFIERYFAQFQEKLDGDEMNSDEVNSDERSTPRWSTRRLLPLVWLSAAIAWGVLAGHPQTFFHIAVVLVLYAIFKALGLSQTQTIGAKIKTAFGHLAAVGGAFVLGGALTAMMTIPFAEYLLSSFKFIARSEWVNSSFLPANMAINHFIPDFFGHPVLGRERFVTSNYNESSMSYVGLTMLFLAIAGVLWQWKKPVPGVTRFYAVLALFCAAVIYRFPLVFSFVTSLPVFHQVHNQRLALEFGFCLVVLGCSALQQMMSAEFSAAKLKAAAICSLALFGVLLVLNRDAFADIQRWQLAVLAGFVLNVLLLAGVLWWCLKRRQFRALAALVLLETAAHGVIFNTVSAEKDFYPENPVTTFLSRKYRETGGKTLSIGYAMPPNLGSWYGFAQVREYDSIGMRAFENLRKSIDPKTGATDTFGTQLNLTDLRFAGIRYILGTGAEAAILQKKHPELKRIFTYKNYVVLEHPTLPSAFLLPAQSFAEAQSQLGKLRANWKAVPIQSVQTPYLWNRSATEQDLFFDYTASKPSFLIINQSYMPGWSGRITDGKQADENRANHWIPTQAVGVVKVLPVPEGKHRVQLAYRPNSLKWGMSIFALASLMWISLLVICLKAKQQVSVSKWNDCKSDHELNAIADLHNPSLQI